LRTEGQIRIEERLDGTDIFPVVVEKVVIEKVKEVGSSRVDELG